MKRVISLFCLFLIASSSFAEDTWTTIQPSYQEVSLIGFSRARHHMVLSTEVSGKVEKVFVDIGDTISETGLVSCLDPTFTKIDIESTNNDIALARIDIDFYRKQVDRYTELVKKKNISINQLDEMKRQLGTARRIKQSKKLLREQQRETLERHCIKSPAGWLVEERYIQAGQWLDVGSPVVKVGDYSKLLVPFALTMNELNSLKKQQNLTVWLAEYDQSVPASIERISPTFDEKSRKIQVDLLLEKDIPAQRGGLRVDLKLKLTDSLNKFLISSKALDRRFEESWIKRKNGQSLRVEFLGLVENGLARIKSSELKQGDQFEIIQH